MRTCADAITASLTKLSRLPNTGGWQERHRAAFGSLPVIARGKGDAEWAIAEAIKAAAIYADAHAARFDSPIGEDGVLGPHFAGWLSGLLGLLNGETGRLDCGTLDGLIREIGRIAGVVDENGEIRE